MPLQTITCHGEKSLGAVEFPSAGFCSLGHDSSAQDVYTLTRGALFGIGRLEPRQDGRSFVVRQAGFILPDLVEIETKERGLGLIEHKAQSPLLRCACAIG